MLIEVTAGHENFSNPAASTRVNVLYRKKAKEDAVGIWAAMKDKHSGIRSMNMSYIDASGYNRNHGNWCTIRADVEEGAYIDVQIKQHQIGEINKFNLNCCNMMLFARPQAAFIRIAINLTGHSKAAVDKVYIEGRFDIILADQFDELGITVPSSLKNYYDLESMEDLITIEQLEKAVAPLTKPGKKETITTTDGQKIVVKKKGKRNIRLS